MVNASAAKLFRHLQLLLAGKVGMEALEVDPRCNMICQNTQMHMPLRAGPIRRDTVEEGGCLLLLLFLSRHIRGYKGIVTVYGMPEMSMHVICQRKQAPFSTILILMGFV